MTMKKEVNILLFSAFLQSCTPIADCKNELIYAQSNSDNTRHLYAFTRNCGTTTSESIQLSLFNKNISLDDIEGGNIFIADGKPTLESYKEAISIKWIDKKALEVQFDKTLRVFKKDTVWNNIRIRYLLK